MKAAEGNIDNSSDCFESDTKIFLLKKSNRNVNSEKRNSKYNTRSAIGRWTKQEHQKFMKACLEYGNNWKKV